MWWGWAQFFTGNMDLFVAMFRYWSTLGRVTPAPCTQDPAVVMLLTVSLDGFMELLDQGGVLQPHVLGASTAKVCFTLAKTGIVDELKSVGRTAELSFVEFLEAFARVADAVRHASLHCPFVRVLVCFRMLRFHVF